MGVKGLHSYMERRMPPRDFAIGLHELRARANGADMVVVDGMALIRRLYPQELDWVGGGQFQELLCNVGEFVAAFEGTEGYASVAVPEICGVLRSTRDALFDPRGGAAAAAWRRSFAELRGRDPLPEEEPPRAAETV